MPAFTLAPAAAGEPGLEMAPVHLFLPGNSQLHHHHFARAFQHSQRQLHPAVMTKLRQGCLDEESSLP